MDVKVPLNWYQHRIFREKPLITEDFPPSYNLYQDEQEDFQVIVVHTSQVNETVNLTKRSDSAEYLYDDHVSRFLSDHLDDTTLDQNIKFPLKLSEWIAASCQYRHDQEYFYLSFSPENSVLSGNQLLKTAGACLIREIEWRNKGNPDQTTEVNNLNHQALYANAIELRCRIESSHRSMSPEVFADLIQWGTWQNNQTCSSLILSLLSKDEIGATERVPAFGRSGTLSSLLLLSLRPAFAVSVLYRLCYELIVNDSSLISAHRHRHHGSHSVDTNEDGSETHNLLIASSLIFLSVGALSGIEKLLARIFPFLKNTACRERELVEVRSADFIVQWVGFSSVPIVSLWCNLQLFETYFQHGNTELLIALDSIASFIKDISVYFISTYLMSRLLYFFQHGCFQTPAFAAEMLSFVNKTKAIPKELLEWQFKKEWALNIITGSSLLANITVLRYATYLQDDFDNQFLFLGGSTVLFVLGYTATKLRINYLDKQQKLEKAELEKKNPVSELALQQLRSHDPKPELFFLIAFSSSVLMLVAAERLPSNWPFEATLLVTTLIGLSAYVGSLFFYHAVHKAEEVIRASNWNYSLFSNTSEIENHEHETHRLRSPSV